MRFMKLTKILSVVCALAIFAAIGITAFAADDSVYTAKTKITDDTIKHEHPALTKEQKAEMKARKVQFDALQKKWAALTDAQKEEIYALKDKAADIRAQIIDKYLEWGIIDKAEAADMKKRIIESKTNMRESGRMPMSGGHCKDGNKKSPKQ